jgi:hypothetical protein
MLDEKDGETVTNEGGENTNPENAQGNQNGQENQEKKDELPSDWWSSGGKYKTPQDAMAAQKAAEREMHIKQQEAALLRQKVELLEKQYNQPKAEQVVDNEPPEHVKQALEQKYGKPYQEIKLQFDLNALNEEKLNKTLDERIKPLRDNLLNQQYEVAKRNLAEDVVYQQYPAEFEARLNMLPLESRVDKQELKRIRLEIIDEKLPEMLLKSKNENVGGKPKTPPSVPSGGNAPYDDDNSFQFTPAQIAEMQKFGHNPKDMKDYIQGKTKRASQWGRNN